MSWMKWSGISCTDQFVLLLLYICGWHKISYEMRMTMNEMYDIISNSDLQMYSSMYIDPYFRDTTNVIVGENNEQE